MGVAIRVVGASARSWPPRVSQSVHVQAMYEPARSNCVFRIALPNFPTTQVFVESMILPLLCSLVGQCESSVEDLGSERRLKRTYAHKDVALTASRWAVGGVFTTVMQPGRIRILDAAGGQTPRPPGQLKQYYTPSRPCQAAADVWALPARSTAVTERLVRHARQHSGASHSNIGAGCPPKI